MSVNIVPEQFPEDEEAFGVAVALRRADLLGCVRLPIAMDLMPGEGLGDLIFRAAYVNGYRRIAPIAKILQIPHWRQMCQFTNEIASIDLRALSDLLGTPTGARDLEKLVFKKGRDGKHIIFFGREIRRSSLTGLRMRRVSALALREGLYQRAVWGVRILSFDPRTRETLRDECPNCGTPLTFAVSTGAHRCANSFASVTTNDGCKHVDLRDVPLPVMETNDEEALQFVLRLIDPEYPIERLGDPLIPAALEYLGAGQIFELITAFAKMIVVEACQGETREQLDGGFRFRLPTADELAQAARAVISWPDGYHVLAETLRRARVGQTRDWKGGRWYPLARIDVTFDAKLRALLVHEAERARGLLFDVPLPGNSRQSSESDIRGEAQVAPYALMVNSTPPRVPASVIRAFRRGDEVSAVDRVSALRRSRNLSRTATSLGVALPFAGELYDRNLINVVDTDLEGFVSRPGKPPSATLEYRLELVAQKGAMPPEAMRLSSAISSLTVRRINPVPLVLEAICDGRLLAWLKKDHSQYLSGRLWIDDFAQLRRLLADAPLIEGLESVRLTATDARFVTCLDRKILNELCSLGLFQRFPTMEDAWTIREKYISIRELECRCRLAGKGIGRSEIGRELAASGLQKLEISMGSIRRRDVVEDYFGDRIAPLL